MQPEPGASEQDPDKLTAETVRCLAECVRAVGESRNFEIEAVALSSILGSMIPLAADGSPLANAMTWADLRSSPDCTQAKLRLAEDDLYADTGCTVHTLYVGPKIAWLRRRHPSIFHAATHFVPTKAYLVQKLTGELLFDRSVASGSGLLRLAQPEWSGDWLAYLGADGGQLGDFVEPTTALKFLPEVAKSVGLPPATPLVIGAADGMLSSLGVGALRQGQYAAMLATSGAFRTVRDEPVLHPRKKTWAIYLADDLWVCGASLSSGGIVYRWVRDTFFAPEAAALEARGMDGYDAVNAAAAQAPRGAEGLLILPYLSGERSPNWNVDARGIIVGLTLSHNRRHIARAAMEGISLHYAQAAAGLIEVCGPPTEIRTTGGYRQSELWTQILSETLAQELALPPNEDASGFGAALLAMRTQGVFNSLFAAGELVPIQGRVVPDPAAVKQYAALSELYEKVYSALEPTFAGIAGTKIGLD